MRVALPSLIALLVTAQAAAQRPSPAERKAFHLSLWATIVPVATGALWWASQKSGTAGGAFSAPDRSGPSTVMSAGFVFGPALGYWSAGLSGRGWRGIGIRSGLTLLSYVPAFAMCGWDCSKGDDAYDDAWLVIATGAGLSAASAVYDIARVRHNVRRHEARADTRLSIVPIYEPGQRRLGMRVGLRF